MDTPKNKKKGRPKRHTPDMPWSPKKAKRSKKRPPKVAGKKAKRVAPRRRGKRG